MGGFRESDVLKRLLKARTAPSHVLEGVNEQDDCAVLSVPSDVDLCATTDFVRGTGFALHRLGYLSMRQLGRYVVAANVSDLAAMGAKPLAYLSVVRYGPDRTLEEVEDILLGIEDACEAFECPLVGGDSGSYERDVLTGTALGVVPRGRRLSRTTVLAGDIIFVSGAIGGAAAALGAAVAGVEKARPAAFQRALDRWRQPSPRTALGRALVDLPVRVSCMDISDGLTASLQQLVRISGLGFVIDSKRLPIDPSVQELALELGIDPVHLACSASVDFELLVTCAAEHAPMVMASAAASNTALAEVGRCLPGGEIQFLREDGSPFSETPGAPWDHQANDLSRFFHAKG
jgi:thiamine-monophosphate kinase